ncbi:MAG: uroporphyrinogen decarboxylase family protein [Pseudomonadales bacterium]|jgi:uroporphyrinogen decarboxylase|nr:uroporphyrinogen decarboxylase family protein [Pseudomonadales bacterium]MDP6470470.1 uroporphyrinogen decarboxylase family protein [Pseudomonadales bacterium]MDP6827772.1 uroporphyrinogen decarboxylase family protein [Pseudomonadales bacterium]MDP6973414.1 uroporphyrinogen decarboxylase family protein [Pseudomonadales bacterium]|tara:strand:+ start:280 stop:1269 length:990 start_codon:yes stop_codon:yes gene_type:complete
MNHKERVSAVLAGKAPDLLPVSSWGHDFLREGSAEQLAAHTIERQKSFDYDFVKLNPRWTLFAEPWGNRYEPPTEQVFPRLVHKVVNQPSDLGALAAVSANHPVFLEYERSLAMVLDEIGEELDVIATLFSPLACVGLLCGGVGAPLVGFAHSDARTLRHALEQVTPVLRSLAERLIARGASGVFYAPLQWTSLDVCSAAFYEQFGRPYDMEVLAGVEEAHFNMLHVCGNHIEMQRFIEYPVQVLNWDNFGDGNPNLGEIHAKTDKVVAGGVPHRQLHKLDAPALRHVAANAVGGLAERLMLTGGCAVGAQIGDDVRLSIARLPAELAA